MPSHAQSGKEPEYRLKCACSWLLAPLGTRHMTAHIVKGTLEGPKTHRTTSREYPRKRGKGIECSPNPHPLLPPECTGTQRRQWHRAKTKRKARLTWRRDGDLAVRHQMKVESADKRAEVRNRSKRERKRPAPRSERRKPSQITNERMSESRQPMRERNAARKKPGRKDSTAQSHKVILPLGEVDYTAPTS